MLAEEETIDPELVRLGNRKIHAKLILSMLEDIRALKAEQAELKHTIYQMNNDNSPSS